MAEKRGSKRSKPANAESLADEVKAAVGKGGRDFVWVREDGAVCFGDECVVVKGKKGGALDFVVDPGQCGSAAGKAILDHLLNTAGRGVNIKVKSIKAGDDE